MNTDFSQPLADSVSAANRAVEPPVRLSRVLLGLAMAVAAFDVCFWGVKAMGLSVAIFVLLLAAIILGNRESWRGGRLLLPLLLLLAGGLLAGAIETGTTNTLVLIILIVAIAGETYYVGTESFWGRWLSQCCALVFAPGRPFWLAARLLEATVKRGVGGIGGLIGTGLLVLPALVLALVFGSLLASGNAVFGSWTHSFFDWFWKELALYLDFWRIVLWLVVGFITLPLLRPANISPKWWKSTVLLSPLPEIIPTRGAIFSSGLVLVVLNLLFFIANLSDVLFLWSGDSLPKGVTYSGFVHNGTNALTVTALLSALVLASIFQQEPKVARSRILKGLGLVWIAQNLFLLLSVALRLKLYIEACDMTVLRLSVIIFLALVAVGYALLTLKIVQDRSLAWLIGGCMLAIFATFYITQFLNLGGWAANYNVAQWEKDRTRNLDISYITTLGPGGWPALRRATDEGADWTERYQTKYPHPSPMEYVRSIDLNRAMCQLSIIQWREFSLRAWMNRWALGDSPKWAK